MAVVQSTKTAGNITVEATSSGLTPVASVTITARAVTLRPQVAVWEREVPTGSGITGLWRPVPAADSNPLAAFLGGGNNMVFTLKQDGNDLTGSVEGGNGGFFGGSDVPAAITEGKVDGDRISFKAGTTAYIRGHSKATSSIFLAIDESWLPQSRKLPLKLPGSRPAVGPSPPDGSDHFDQ